MDYLTCSCFTVEMPLILKQASAKLSDETEVFLKPCAQPFVEAQDIPVPSEDGSQAGTDAMDEGEKKKRVQAGGSREKAVTTSAVASWSRKSCEPRGGRWSFPERQSSD